MNPPGERAGRANEEGAVPAASALATRNIFLIGPMGSGKSTVGRCLAEQLHREFQDTDQEIEARTGAAIALIFEIEGEAGFRKRESAVLDDLTHKRDLVLATGGGVVLLEENRQWLRDRGIVVYLHAALETLVKRTRHDRHRPLLQTADRRGALAQILAAREPLYRATAHVVIETSTRAPTAVARDVVKKLMELAPDIVHEDA